MRSGGKSECGNVQSTAASHSVSESVPGPPPLPLTAPSVSTSAAAAADTSAALPPATAEPPQHFPHAGSSSLTTVSPHKAGEELLPLADRVLAVLDAVNTADDAMVDGAASGGVVSLVSRAPLHALMALFLDDRIPLRALTSALLPRRFYSGAKHVRAATAVATCAPVALFSLVTCFPVLLLCTEPPPAARHCVVCQGVAAHGRHGAPHAAAGQAAHHAGHSYPQVRRHAGGHDASAAAVLQGPRAHADEELLRHGPP